MAAGLPTMRALGRPDPGLGDAGRPRGEALRRRRARLARAPRSSSPTRTTPATRACSSRRPRGSSRPRASPSPTASRSGPTRSATARTGSCSTPTRRPSRESPAAKDPRFRVEHAQILDAADIPRFGRLGVLAVDAGDPLPVRPALGPEAPRRRARRRGGLRVAEAARHRRPHPQRHRRAGRGRLADPELPRDRDAPGRERPAAGRLRPRPEAHPRGGAAHDDARRRLRQLRRDGEGARSRSASSPTSSCCRRTSWRSPTTRS